MDLFRWFLELPSKFVEIGEMLTSTLFEIGGLELNLLEIFGVGILTVIITAKIISLAIPT